MVRLTSRRLEKMEIVINNENRNSEHRNIVDEILGRLPEEIHLENFAARESQVSPVSSTLSRISSSGRWRSRSSFPRRRIGNLTRNNPNSCVIARRFVADINPVRHTTSTSTESVVNGRISRLSSPIENGLKSKVHNVLETCFEIAEKSAVPVLEDVNHGKIWERLGRLFSFVTCVASVSYLCWYLDLQTKSNPISEDTQAIPINQGPLPAIAISTGDMFRKDFIVETERLLRENQTNDTSVASCGIFGRAEKNALAFILGQIAASLAGSNSNHLLDITTKYIDSYFLEDLKVFNTLEDASIQAAVCFIKQGMKNCSEVVTKCGSAYDNDQDCSQFFFPQVTEKGFVCIFNPVPYKLIERKQTIRGKLSFASTGITRPNWNILNFNKLSFSEDYKVGEIFYSQTLSGERNGLEFTVLGTGENTWKPTITIANPVEPMTYRHREETLQSGKKHLFSLEVKSEHSSDNIRRIRVENGRNCLFFDEKPVGNYKGYTQGRCREAFLAAERDCSFISDPDIHFGADASIETSWKPLCHPNLWKDEMFRIHEGVNLQFGNSNCIKSCSNLAFKYYTWSEALLGIQNTNNTRVVVFFGEDEVETRVRNLRRFVAEEIGIVLGMLGFCNDITLPKILRFIGIHGLVICEAIFTWMRKLISRWYPVEVGGIQQ